MAEEKTIMGAINHQNLPFMKYMKRMFILLIFMIIFRVLSILWIPIVNR